MTILLRNLSGTNGTDVLSESEEAAVCLLFHDIAFYS